MAQSQIQGWAAIRQRGERRIAAMTAEDHKKIHEGNALLSILSKPKGAK